MTASMSTVFHFTKLYIPVSYYISFLDHAEDIQTEQEKEAHAVRNLLIAYDTGLHCRSLPHHFREPSHIQLFSMYSFCGLYHYYSG